MSDQVTKTDLNNLEGRLEKRFDNLTALMSQFADDVSSRFDVHDEEFKKIHKKLDEHDKEFRKINQKYDHLLNTIDTFIGRIDSYETELAARDHKIDRLERWIEQIAAKTNIQLV